MQWRIRFQSTQSPLYTIRFKDFAYLDYFRVSLSLPLLRFAGAETNICFNALDRHVAGGKGDKVAFIYEGNDGESAQITYKELLEQTCRLANVLKEHAVQPGDKVRWRTPNSCSFSDDTTGSSSIVSSGVFWVP